MKGSFRLQVNRFWLMLEVFESRSLNSGLAAGHCLQGGPRSWLSTRQKGVSPAGCHHSAFFLLISGVCLWALGDRYTWLSFQQLLEVSRRRVSCPCLNMFGMQRVTHNPQSTASDAVLYEYDSRNFVIFSTNNPTGWTCLIT